MCSSQQRVPLRKAALKLGGDYLEGSGYVTEGVIIVSRVDASRELQDKLGENMGSWSVSVCLCLVFEMREPPLEPTVTMAGLVHRTIVVHQTHFGLAP